jgi:hypothetical protein
MSFLPSRRADSTSCASLLLRLSLTTHVKATPFLRLKSAAYLQVRGMPDASDREGVN